MRLVRARVIGWRGRSVPGLALATGAAVWLGVPAMAGGDPTTLVFEEQGAERGLSYLIGTPFSQLGAGLALVDLNNSGLPDAVILGAVNNLVGVYENVGGGQFVNRSFSAGIGPMAGPSGVSAADYDGDGLLDLFISGWFTPNRLLKNNGNFTFTDVTAAAGLSLTAPALATAWSDFDSDGWLDLYVTVRTGTNANTTRNKFYRNNGDGTFTEMAGALGIDCGNDPSLLAMFFDYDRDGLDDLYVGVDKGAAGGLLRNRLFRNTGGGFEDITAQANAEAYIECMGMAIGDLDFNGFFDVYMTNNLVGNVLLMGQPDGVFTDATAASGMAANRYGWGTVFADFDNDTHLDTFVCNLQGENQLFHGGPAWPLPEVGAGAGVNLPGTSYSVSVADVDGDHLPDVLVDHSGNRVKLYMNRTQTDHNYARFKIVGQGPNTFAVGAQMDLLAGGVWQARQIHAGANYKSTNEFVIHVGLGDADVIDEAIVRWPGTGDTRTLTNIPAGAQWTIHPPERLGDFNNDGRFGRADARAMLQAMTGPGVPIQPGQEIFDMDGDFDVDIVDMGLLNQRLDPRSGQVWFP